MPDGNDSMLASALEQRWKRLLARLQAVAPLLARQGTLAPKTGARTTWCVRYLDDPHGGKRVRRMIYIGNDPELVRRTGEYLEQCRAQWLDAKEALNLARFALTLGSQVQRRMQRWVGCQRIR
jgi:hypothetical protein